MNTAKKITRQEQEIIDKIRTLAPERVAEGEDFIDFLHQQTEDRELVRAAAAKLSEDSFTKVWDNPDDAVYDRL
ncbi:MAG TPA: toxin-antitoxin system, antitoxin component, Xre family protein [Deltaproteobacteria bacterium]|jgi:hypothetical protein|nr:toxin-antitoxin system, antitoxin component, Xre family protein [Deltaproteobacteria bacterium]